MSYRFLPVTLVVLLAFAAVPALGQERPGEIAEREVGDALRYDAAGGITASGEPYNPERLTVAHATLPYGTLVEINFRRRSVTARVNDRDTGGGLVRVSSRVADQLGLPPGGGQVEVRLDPGEVAFLREQAARREATATPARTVATADPVEGWDRYTVQLGSFTDAGRAREHAGRQRGTWVQSVTLGGDTVYRVYYGIYPTREAAGRALEALRDDGLHGFIQGLRGDVSEGEDRHALVSMSHGGGTIEESAQERQKSHGIAEVRPESRSRGW